MIDLDLLVTRSSFSLFFSYHSLTHSRYSTMLLTVFCTVVTALLLHHLLQFYTVLKLTRQVALNPHRQPASR